jgi:hypothetical protein
MRYTKARYRLQTYALKKMSLKRLLPWLFLIALLALVGGLVAQEDGLNLPTELYILLNDGVVERYGLGATGVEPVSPDGEFVVDFAVAPDGGWLAYRTETGLMLSHLAAGTDGETHQLEGESANLPPLRGRGDTMAWSPAGDALAYTTTYGLRIAFEIGGDPLFNQVAVSPLAGLRWSPGGTFLAAEAENNVWWIYRREGVRLHLASAIPSSRGLAWFDDNRLIFAPEEGGLFLMDLGRFNEQSLLRGADDLYWLPYVRADRSIVAYTRPAAEEVADENSAYFQRLTIQADGSIAPALTGDALIDLSGLRWAPGGQLMIAARDSALLLLLPDSGEGFPLPVESVVAYGWGAPPAPDVFGFVMSHDGFFLAPDFRTGQVQVWRLTRDGQPPAPLTASPEDISSYGVAANGSAIAYVSAGSLWAQPLTGSSEAIELAAVDPGADDVAFSVDGSSIAFATPGSQNDPRGGVWIIPAAGGEPQLILANGPDVDPPALAPPFFERPQFAPDRAALLVAVTGGQETSFLVLDPASGGVTDLGQYTEARWLPDGRVLAFGNETGPAVIDIIDASSAPAQTTPILREDGALILDAREIEPGRVWAVLATANRQRGPSPARLVEASGGAAITVAELGFLAGPELSPDGAFVAGMTRAGGQLVMITLPAERQLLAVPTGVEGFRWAPFR